RRTERTQVDLPLLVIQRPRGRFRTNRALFGAEIEDARPGALLRLPDRERLVLHDARHGARRVVQIAEDTALRRTDDPTRRQQLVLDAVRAEVALVRRVRVRIDEELIVRARLHAGAAADAARRIQIDDGVAAFEEGFGRADADARRVRALIAE